MITIGGSLILADAEIDPAARALMCCQHARDFIWAARAAREVGHTDLALAWLKSAEVLRIAASVWRQRAARRGSP
jgi:hypothetical protein